MPIITLPISVASSGDNVIQAAVSGKLIAVKAYVLVADGAVTAQFYDGASANNLPLSGPLSFAANGGAVAPLYSNPDETHGGQWFKTSLGNALVLKLGGAVGVRGHMVLRIGTG